MPLCPTLKYSTIHLQYKIKFLIQRQKSLSHEHTEMSNRERIRGLNSAVVMRDTKKVFHGKYREKVSRYRVATDYVLVSAYNV